MAEPKTCDMKGCKLEAISKVILRFRRHKGDQPVKAESGLHVCGLHREVPLSDIIPTDGAWLVILDHFPPGWQPARELTNVLVVPITP